MSSQPQAGHGRHPTFMQYVVVATFLFVLTIIEFVIIYPHYRLGPITVPALIFLSAIKFAAVIMFYMHLKFDHKLFTYIFLGGLALGFAVGLALLGLFAALNSTPQPRAFAQAQAVPYEHGEGQPAPGQEMPVPGQQEPVGEMVVEGQAPEPAGSAELIARGQTVAQNNACLGCHSIDGSALVGPSWKGLHGRQVTLTDGTTVTADDAYLRESIKDPNAKVVQGFLPNLMPATFGSTLSDSDIDAIIAYIKSLE